MNIDTASIKALPVKDIIGFLEKVGRIPSEQSQSYRTIFLDVLDNKNDKVRVHAVKNLAKLGDETLIDVYQRLIDTETSSAVRREVVSAVGRMRSEKNIPLMQRLLTDHDPEVVLQSLRGLMVFKKDAAVLAVVQRMAEHPNEIVRNYVTSELNKDNAKDATHAAANPLLLNTIVNGDVLDVLKNVGDEEVHLTFTSPPYYNARDYSIYTSYDEYVAFLKTVFKEVHRITKEGRFLIVNTSPIIIPRTSRTQASKRYPIPYDLHGFMDEIGWEFIDDIVWVKPEASVKNRIGGFLQHRKPLAYKPNSRTEMLMVYRKKSAKLIDWNLKQYDDEIVNESLVGDGYETSNVWFIDPKSDKVHSAVFPVKLCELVIKYYSLVGDLVFDPFTGSGTMAKAAVGLKRSFFGTEKNPEYFERIKENVGFDGSGLIKVNGFKYHTVEQFKKLIEENNR